jgi:hypothetical protein
MTSCNELYSRQSVSETFSLGTLKGCYYDHIQECDITDDGILYSVEQTRVKIKYLKRHNFDFRRAWELATVWFDDKPIMVIQNAGREGDDHAKRFITDKDGFVSMCEFIKSICATPVTPPADDVYDPSSDLSNLTSFYGNALDGYFERY